MKNTNNLAAVVNHDNLEVNVSYDTAKASVKGGLMISIKGLKVTNKTRDTHTTDIRKDAKDVYCNSTNVEIADMSLNLNGDIDYKGLFKVALGASKGDKIQAIGSMLLNADSMGSDTDIRASVTANGVRVQSTGNHPVHTEWVDGKCVHYHEQAEDSEVEIEGFTIEGSLKDVVDGALELKASINDIINEQNVYDEAREAEARLEAYKAAKDNEFRKHCEANQKWFEEQKAKLNKEWGMSL